MRHPTDDLTALLDGALSPARKREVEDHLASCVACREEQRQLLSALRVLESLPPPPEPSAFFGTRLEARLDDLRRQRERGFLSRFLSLWRISVPVGALALAAVLAVVVVRTRETRERELAAHLELLENYDVVANLDTLSSPEDAVVAANLDVILPSRGRR